jgi:60 kDa SS-A/Ro ribonucleoprotein
VRPDGKAALPDALAQFEASERLARCEDATEAALLIAEHKLPRECVPTKLLNSLDVWEALLADMPMTAMIRSLGKMSEIGLLQPRSAAARAVAERLSDAKRIKGARVHPLAILLALSVYERGRGMRGKLKWEPVASVVDALDRAFMLAFGNVRPTGKRLMLALDVSGSMTGGSVAGAPLTPRVASAAMAMVTAHAEDDVAFRAFCDRLVPLTISRRQRLDDIVKAVDRLPFGGTDCALPMLAALEAKEEVDAFVVYTDSETWYGDVHPVQALERYRQKTGIAARLIVVGMVSNGFTIADPNDAGMLDVVGFDAAAPAVMADFIAARI